jgi:hypothetical protein
MGTKSGVIDIDTYTVEVFVSPCGEIYHGKMVDKASGETIDDGGSLQKIKIEELNQQYGSKLTWKTDKKMPSSLPTNSEIFAQLDLLIARYNMRPSCGSPSFYTEWDRIKDLIPHFDPDYQKMELMLKQNSDFEREHFDSLR